MDISRIKAAMMNPRFLERILTPSERAISQSATFVAGRWAAKEALYKVVKGLTSYQDIEILCQPNGVPTVSFLREGLLGKDGQIHLSISHEKGMAVAVAVLE